METTNNLDDLLSYSEQTEQKIGAYWDRLTDIVKVLNTTVESVQKLIHDFKSTRRFFVNPTAFQQSSMQVNKEFKTFFGENSVHTSFFRKWEMYEHSLTSEHAIVMREAHSNHLEII